MGSIEVYDHKSQRWIQYVPDHRKWEQHFSDLSAGRVRPDHKGRYIVGSGARWRPETTLKVQLVTPVAQTLEMAKSELASPKVIRGRKRRRTFNQLDES